MTDSEKELVNRLRAWADPVESGYEIPAAGRSMREAADAIERLVRERDEARAKTAISMGVGDGSGNLFVYGDYDSIKAAQGFVTRIEELVRERDEARAERDRDCIALGLEIKALRNDAEAAEAEVVKLKAALTKIEDETSDPLAKRIARAALEAK